MPSKAVVDKMEEVEAQIERLEKELEALAALGQKPAENPPRQKKRMTRKELKAAGVGSLTDREAGKNLGLTPQRVTQYRQELRISRAPSKSMKHLLDIQAIAAQGGEVTTIAAQLGLSKVTIYRLAKLGGIKIPSPRYRGWEPEDVYQVLETCKSLTEGAKTLGFPRQSKLSQILRLPEIRPRAIEILKTRGWTITERGHIYPRKYA